MIWLATAPLAAPGVAAAQASTVLVATVDGPLTPVIVHHLTDAADKASAGGHQALQVELATPRGLETAMRQIIKAFLAADTPVTGYVSPPDGGVSSAGVLIAFSAHVAPGTTIRDAMPVHAETGETARGT